MKRGSPMLWVGITLLAVLALVVVILSGGSEPDPFDPGSSAPDGYRAIALLLGRGGVDVRTVPAGELPRASMWGPGRALVVPVESYATTAQRKRFRDIARNGSTVVVSTPEDFVPLDNRQLTRTPAVRVPRGFCDIAELETLRAVDDIDGSVLVRGAQQCFADSSGALVSREPVGTGSLVRLSSPYLWANARLQPDKEERGQPLDNAATAVALLGDVDSVSFVPAVPARGVVPGGSQDPLSLMPFGVKLALAQGVGAFVLYAWWRARRLGRPVREELPVEVQGSELVAAFGGLLRSNATPARAAEVLRSEARRQLSARLGVPLGADAGSLASVLASRTGADPSQVYGILVSNPVSTADELVRLSRALDAMRTEVLDGQPVN